MNLQAIKYLAALAQHRHFGKAAAACFVSQPTLSMQIKKLEEELGVQLLERTNKSVMMTEIGMQLAVHATTVLQEISQMQEIAKAVHDPEAGPLRIGIIPTLAPYLLPHVMPELMRIFPRVEYHLIEAQTKELMEKLKCAAIDSIVVALPLAEKNLTVVPLFEEEFLLAVPLNHPLAKRTQIHETDLCQQDLLLLEEGHCLREQALKWCDKTRAVETKNFRATSLETLRQMVCANIGMTLMPKLACEKNKKISYIPFSAKKPPSRKVGLVWRSTAPKSILLHKIAAVLQNAVSKNLS